ncbi:MAG: 2-dehydropantoate 2-reductase [Methyloceanibacter sp.]|nr:MAG: 2-dehydropantoate 2-reductase [Methyloceanibacter sp.]
MSQHEELPITVAGAGSVGCYMGGLLAAAGRTVTLLTRPHLAKAVREHGLRVSDLDGRDITVAPNALSVETDPDRALDGARIVLVTVKSHDTAEMAALIAAHADQDARIVSLQNGVRNAGVLRHTLGNGRVVDAMVPFNVVQTRPAGGTPRFHRASGGTVLIERGDGVLRSLLGVPGAPAAEHDDIEAVLWGKLLVNLNNGLNALSGLPIVAQFGDRRWRGLVARQLDEGIAVLRAAGIRHAPYEGVPARVFALALRLPDALFRLAAKRIFAIDESARSSMWEDLEAGRRTEIDHLQGEIIRLAGAHGVPAPLNRAVLARVKEAERAKNGSPGLPPEDLNDAR